MWFLRELSLSLSLSHGRWFIEHALPVVVHELSTRVAPSAVTIWFGANDAALRSGWEAYQHVPLETYRQNLAHIVRTLAPLLPLHAKLLLIAPPAVMDSARRAASATGADLDRSNASAGECARACVQVAAAEGVDVLDLHTLLNSAYPIERDRAALFSDGLHFTHAGNAVVAAHVAAAIGAIIENASERERLRAWQFPDFRDLIQS